MPGVLKERQRYTGKTRCDEEGRDHSGAAANQGTPKTADKPRKLGRASKDVPNRFQRERGPDDSVISDFMPPAWWKNTLLLH